MKFSFIAGVAVMAILACQVHADVTLTQEDCAGKPCYRLDNGRVSLRVDPARGGAVISYRDKLGGDVDVVPEKSPNGLCIDHFQSQDWPGEMLGATYEVIDRKNDPQACALVLRYTVTGRWGGNEEARLKDLVLEKTYTLRADSPALECRIKITAPKKDSKLLAYWQQNIFFAGGQYDRATDKSFRPTTRGVRVKAGENWGATGPESFVRDISAGWLALLDTQRKTGLVMLSDYNELDALYANGGNATLESMYRITYLPAGQAVEYIAYIVPVVGLDNVVAATTNYIAGYRMKSDGHGTGQLALSAIRSANAPAALSLKVSLLNVQKPAQVTPVGTVAFAALGDQVQTKALAFQNAGADPLVLQVDAECPAATGTVATNRFEEYYNGAYSWGENMTVDMVTPVYRGERPKQKLTLYKPEPLKLKPLPGMQVWYAEGLLDDVYRLTPAMQMSYLPNSAVDRLDRVFTSYSPNWLTKLSSFPYDYERLLSYDLIVLGGVKQESLGNIGQEMLGDYLRAGGGMIVLGGPAAYGAAHLGGTPLGELLPVTMANTAFDTEKLADAVLQPTPTGASILEDLDWSAKPRVRYLHKATAKPWGNVVVEADGRPFLVIGEVGPNKARVACILGVPMGMAEANAAPFWQWKDWTYLMRQVIWWTMKENARFPKAAQ
ncbi:MAG: glutamine amidotransferase [Kiritimatiellae bacterium]|nr:glutamine amidotransferase [Kiritimatiellia bacterium]